MKDNLKSTLSDTLAMVGTTSFWRQSLASGHFDLRIRLSEQAILEAKGLSRRRDLHDVNFQRNFCVGVIMVMGRIRALPGAGEPENTDKDCESSYVKAPGPLRRRNATHRFSIGLTLW